MSAEVMVLSAHRKSLSPAPAPQGQRWPQRWFARRRLRKLLQRELLCAPDCVLIDAGWTRSEVRQEIAKPMWRA